MFENPLMLAALGGAVVPLVIHLLGRARYRTLEWGAMMFIDLAPFPRWRDGARLREYVLLAVRMGAVALLAVALARPVLGVGRGDAAGAAVGPSLSAEPRAAVAIVIDCSASMGYQDIGPSRMEQARSAALQVLATLKRGDRAVLIAAGAPAAAAMAAGSAPSAAQPSAAQPPAPPQLTGDLQFVAARVADLRPTPAVAALDQALSDAMDVLARQERVARRIYLICDQQAASFAGIDDPFIAAWRARRRLLDRFVVIPVGGREVSNVAIDSVTLLDPPAVRGCAQQVEVGVRNFGPDRRGGLPLTVRVGGPGGETVATTVNVGAGATATAKVPVTFPRAGAVVLTAEVRGAGGPTLDDRRDVVVDVTASLRVLIVRAAVTGGGPPPLPDTLAAALTPFRVAAAGDGSPGSGGAGKRLGNDLAELRFATADHWDSADLAKYHLVVLDDVDSLSDAQADALEQFVYAGGGLLVAPGSASRIDDYNRLLYRDENGLLPVLLQPAVALPTALEIEPTTVETTSPILRFLAADTGIPRPGASSSPLPGRLPVSVDRFFPVTGRTPAAHVLAGFTSGDPFLIEQPFGRGRVLLITCSLRAEWSSLPLTNVYLPLIQSAARYLAAGAVPTRHFAFGDEVVATLTPAVDSAEGSVLRPDGSRDRCEVITSEERSEVRYARTDLPGVYAIRVGPRGAGAGTPAASGADRSFLFSVAPSPVESDLTPLANSALDRLQSDLDFTRVEAGGRALAARLGRAEGGGVASAAGGQYWIVALAGVLALLVLEMALTRYWWAGAGSSSPENRMRSGQSPGVPPAP